MLEQERQEIDRIDRQLIPLLEQRWDVIQRVAKKKHELQLPVHDSKREQIVLNKLNEYVQNQAYIDAIQQIYQTIFELSRRDQTNYLVGKDEKKTL